MIGGMKINLRRVANFVDVVIETNQSTLPLGLFDAEERQELLEELEGAVEDLKMMDEEIRLAESRLPNDRHLETELVK